MIIIINITNDKGVANAKTLNLTLKTTIENLGLCLSNETKANSAKIDFRHLICRNTQVTEGQY